MRYRLPGLIFLLTMLVALLALTGCGSEEPEATATPTKTPRSAAQVQASTDTPTTQPPTDTPTPTPSATPTPTPTEKATPTPEEPTPTPTPAALAQPTTDGVNARKGPSTSYGKVGQVYSSDSLGVYGKNETGSWLKLCCVDDEEAWVSAQLLDISGDLGKVPVVETPALTAETRADRPTGSSGPGAAGVVSIGQVEPAVDTAPPGPYIGLCGLRVNRPPREVPPSRPPVSGNVNPLTGENVDPAKLQRRILAVRFGNEPAIKAYYGLGSADLVFEELLDNLNTTRLTALFLAGDAPQVGPLRSYRSTTIQLAQMYDAALASSGAVGPNQVFAYAAGIEDIDWRCNDAAYYLNPNVPSSDYQNRAVSSIPRLRTYLQSKGIDKPATVRSFAFSAETPDGGRSANSVVVPYVNRGFYEVEWRYNTSTGRYDRFQGTGRRPFVDANDNQQVSAANVVIMTVQHDLTDLIEDSVGSRSVRTYLVNREGPAVIVRDGVALEGKWRVAETWNGLELVDASNSPINLKPGNTWFQIVPPSYDVAVR